MNAIRSETRTTSVALFDGLPAGSVSETARATLADAGVLGPVHVLELETFAPCQGCFQCWVDSPGMCKTRDDANVLMRDLMRSDDVLWTTKLRFGCWSAETKCALDRAIGILSPFFETVHGETHHRARYSRYPRIGALAVTGPSTTQRERDVFRMLVARNAVNMHTTSWVGFVPEGASTEEIRHVVQGSLRAFTDPWEDVFPELHPYDGLAAPSLPYPPDGPRHVVLWVGSAKPSGTSTSEALGRHLLARLERRGWSTEVVYAARAVHLGREGAPSLAAAFQRADLVVLASPVYFDALPALVLHGLDLLAGAIGERRPALLPIIQCGFPELEHTALAVEIAALAAAELGLPWAGHLALGGGGMIDGRALDTLGARVAPQLEALELAAEQLDEARPVSAGATARFAAHTVPNALCRLMGNAGWIGSALRRHAATHLWDRPFDPRRDGGRARHLW